MMNNSRSESARQSIRLRSGFTLIELLVVVTIMLLLFAMTVMAVNFNRDAERVTSAALHVQSFLNGARDRAIHAGEPRGVRFFLDRANYRAVSSMAYIDPSQFWSDGTIQLRRWDANDDGVTDAGPSDIIGDGTADEDPTQVRVVAGADPGWWELKRRGLLFDGLRVRIPKGTTGTWYSINTRLIDVTLAKTAVQKLILEIPYSDPGDTQVNRAIAYDSSGPVDYELELAPRILPMDPVRLPADTIIDLDASQLPTAWRPIGTGAGISSGNLQYSQFMDVIFSPRGNVIGNAAAGGVIHFYICDSNDSVALKESYIPSLPNPSGNVTKMKFTENGASLNVGQVVVFNDIVRGGVPFIPTEEIKTSSAAWLLDHPDDSPYLVRDRSLVTVFTQTGGVATHKVNVIDSDFDGIENDPFYFAETGKGGL